MSLIWSRNRNSLHITTLEKIGKKNYVNVLSIHFLFILEKDKIPLLRPNNQAKINILNVQNDLTPIHFKEVYNQYFYLKFRITVLIWLCSQRNFNTKLEKNFAKKALIYRQVVSRNIHNFQSFKVVRGSYNSSIFSSLNCFEITSLSRF